MTHLSTLFLALFVLPAAQPDDVPVLLDFTAEWCGPCRQMRPAVELLEQKGYPIQVIDIDENADLAQRYQVDGVPTFIVVDPDGNELDRISGLRPARELAEMYNAALTQQPGRADAGPSSRELQPTEEIEALAETAPPPRPWETVVRIKIFQGRSVGFGSGTIIKSTPEESIILTCAHIFKVDGRRQQYRPSEFPLKIQVDLFDGKLHGNNPAQVHPIESVGGQAIDYDFATDVGLIRIRPGRRLPASPIVPPNWKPKLGAPMITVGCSEGNDATAWSTTITNPAFGGRLVGQEGYAAIECLHAPKQGRSGGGLYTTEGYLAGVCDFAAPADKKGLYAHPVSIYKLLDRNQFTYLYNPRIQPDPNGPMLAGRGSAPTRRTSSPEPAEPTTTLRAQNSQIPGSPTIPAIPDPGSLNIQLPPLTAAAAPVNAEQPAPATAVGAWQAPAGSRRPAVANDSELLADLPEDPAPGRRVRLAASDDDQPHPVGLEVDPRVSGTTIPDAVAINDEDVPPLPRTSSNPGSSSNSSESRATIPAGGWKRVRSTSSGAGSR